MSRWLSIPGLLAILAFATALVALVFLSLRPSPGARPGFEQFQFEQIQEERPQEERPKDSFITRADRDQEEPTLASGGRH